MVGDVQTAVSGVGGAISIDLFTNDDGTENTFYRIQIIKDDVIMVDKHIVLTASAELADL